MKNKLLLLISIYFIAIPLTIAASPPKKLLEDTIISKDIKLTNKKYIDMCKKEDCGILPLIFPTYKYNTQDKAILEIVSEINNLINTSYNDVISSKINNDNISCSSVKDKYAYEISKNNIISSYANDYFFSILLEQQTSNLCTNETNIKMYQYFYDKNTRETIDQEQIKEAFDITDEVINNAIDTADITPSKKEYIKNNLNNYYIYLENSGSLSFTYFNAETKAWDSIKIYSNVQDYYFGSKKTEEPVKKEEKPSVEKKEEPQTKEQTNPKEKENNSNIMKIAGIIVIIIALLIIIVSIHSYRKIEKKENLENK